MRVTREASAIQRVIGVVAARRANQPLDSTLVVRVLDNRGGALAGATVHWRLLAAGQAAALYVENAVTDSLGESRVRFTPGRTADAQIIAAEVKGVGMIEMPFTVPVAGVRLTPPDTLLWSDDDVVLSAVLTDDSGVSLDGGAVAWTPTDSTVVRVRRIDAQRATARGVLAGTSDVVALVGNVMARTRVRVRPVISGTVTALDGSTPDARLIVRANGRTHPLAIVHGAFRGRVEGTHLGEVELRIASTSDRFHEAHLRVTQPRQLQDLRVVLVPTTWRIDAGAHTGRDVAIDAHAALRPVAGRAPFWRLAPVSGRGLKRILGWRDDRLPIRIAFARPGSVSPITAEDSLAFWAIARQLERDLGAPLFSPASLAGDADAGVVPVEVRAQSAEGHTFVSWTQSGDVNDGVLLFRSASTLRDAHVVTHELLHLLGFGHSTAWHTVSEPSAGRERRLTVQDVAYVQLAWRLRRLEERGGARAGLPSPSQ